MKRLISIIISCLLIFTVACGIVANAADSFIIYDGFEYTTDKSGNAILYRYVGTNNTPYVPAEILGHKVISINTGCFANNTELTSVNLNTAVYLKTIGDRAFQGCESLKSIALTNSVISIGDACFQDCTSLTDVDLGTVITNIPAQAFYGCTALTQLEIPDNVLTIGYSAFSKCTNLEYVKISYMVREINESFTDCNNLTIAGYKNTTAKAYADANKIPFSCLNGDEKDFDINCDGIVNVRDVTQLQRYLVCLDLYDENDTVLCEKLDTNSDEKINVRDVTFLQKLLASDYFE